MKNKKRVLFILLTLFIVRVIYCIYVYNFKYNHWKNNIITVEVICIYTIKDDAIDYVIKYNNDKFLLEIKDKDNIYKYGEKLKILCSNKEIVKYNNPYEFDYKKYLNSKEFVSKIYCTKVLEKYSNKIGVLSSIFHIRELIDKKLDAKLDIKYSSILKSIIYGDSLYLDKNLKQKFSDIGVGHFLCVSGTHIIFLLSSYDKIVMNDKHKCIKIILLIYFYIISFFNISLLRSICMFMCSVLDKNMSFSKKYIISLYVILIINPYNIFNVGVIFSFLSILSINTFNSLINSFFTNKIKSKNKILRIIIDNVSLTISAQILIIPFQVYYFGKIGLICILSSAILCIILNVTMYIGFFLFILFFIPIISDMLILIIGFILKILLLKVDFLDKINYLNLNFPKPNVLIFIIYYIFIIFCLYGKKIGIIYWKWRLNIKCAIYMIKILCIVAIILWYFVTMYFEDYIIFFNVGQGNMALIHKNTTNIIIDIGSTVKNNAGNIMYNFLKAKNINHIDAILISHMHDDHINGVEKLISENINIEYIFYTNPCKVTEEFENLISKINANRISKISVNETDNIKIGDFIIDVLSPSTDRYIQDNDMLNANSTIYLINNKKKNYLFMGDATKKTEQILLEKYLMNDNLEIIKDRLNNLTAYQVSHHGSKTSSYEPFLSKISKCNAIISAKKEVYGHPSEEVLELLKKYKFNVFITQKKGAIKL